VDSVDNFGEKGEKHHIWGYAEQTAPIYGGEGQKVIHSGVWITQEVIHSYPQSV